MTWPARVARTSAPSSSSPATSKRSIASGLCSTGSIARTRPRGCTAARGRPPAGDPRGGGRSRVPHGGRGGASGDDAPCTHDTGGPAARDRGGGPALRPAAGRGREPPGGGGGRRGRAAGAEGTRGGRGGSHGRRGRPAGRIRDPRGDSERGGARDAG